MDWSALSRWEPQALSVLRIASGFLILQHGLQKVFGMIAPTPQPGQPPFQTPPLASLGGISGLLELVGGFLILIGLLTRPTAFVMSGLLAAAYFLAHWPGFIAPATMSFWPILNRGELAALYSFVFLYLFFAGGGPWSVDYCLRRQKV